MAQQPSLLPRFRLRTLLMWMAFAAVACAAIATANAWLLYALRFIVIAFVGANVAMGIASKNEDRAFCLTVGIVGVLLLRFVTGAGALDLAALRDPTNVLLHNTASTLRSWLDGNDRRVITNERDAWVYQEHQIKAQFTTITALILTLIPLLSLAAGYFCRRWWQTGQKD